MRPDELDELDELDGDGPDFAVIAPFPVVSMECDELVVPPPEYATIRTRPEPVLA